MVRRRDLRRRRTHARSWALLLAALLCVDPVVAVAAQKGELVTLDFQNVDIREFIKTVSKLTGRNFLIDQNVRGAVTILGPKPVPLSEVWRIFQSVLAVKGLAVVRVGKLYKIVQQRDAKGENVPVVVGRKPAYYTEQPVIQIVPLNYVQADQVSNFLKNFVGKNGQIFAYNATNVLIIIDNGINVAKLLKLIAEIDSEAQEEVIEIVPLEYLGAEDAVKLLKEIFALDQKQGGKATVRRAGKKAARVGGGPLGIAGAAAGVRMVADVRLNRLILIGSPEALAAVKEMLAKLDVEAPTGGDLIHVYRLQYADAESLAQTLNALITGQEQLQRQSGGKGQKQREGKVQIVADKTNNAIIFISDLAGYRKAMAVLQKLDVPRPQVYVEAAIIEVFLNDSADYSLTGGAARQRSISGQDTWVFGGQALGGVSPLGVSLEALASLNGLFAGAIVTPESGVLPPLGVILRAITTNDNVNVLSTPHLLTSDNEEAEIVVGDNVPFLTGQTATSGGNVITSIERRDVGITLRVKPTINVSDQVRLQIYQEISSVSTQAPSGLDVNRQGLITRKRSAKTNVIVDNGRTVAIGGLISEDNSINESKVPILGDIPIIGWLFKSRKQSRRRTNLLIFLTPHIVRTTDAVAEVSRALAERFEASTEGFMGSAQLRFLKSQARYEPPATDAVPFAEPVSEGSVPAEVPEPVTGTTALPAPSTTMTAAPATTTGP